MMALKDSIEIRAAPQVVFERLLQVFSSSEHYRAWHPDHLECRWIEGRAFAPGSILYFEENLHGKLHRMKCRVASCLRDRAIAYRFSLPMSLLCPKGSFDIEPVDQGCIFTATLYFRGGALFSVFDRGRIEAVARHMKEEGESLKRLSEI